MQGERLLESFLETVCSVRIDTLQIGDNATQRPMGILVAVHRPGGLELALVLRPALI